MMRVEVKGISLLFDPEIGMIAGFEVDDGGRKIAPLHRAPWVDTDEVMPDDAAPHIGKLGGDFFCAPFAASEVASPMHGWPANSVWDTHVDSGALVATLRRKVFGARLTKTLTLRDGHPFIYQKHIFHGGAGRVPVANHANISVESGALISTSAKRVWETPATPQEADPMRGRSGLCYPAQVDDPTAFPGLDRPVDLTIFPWGEGVEDFAMGLEHHDSPLGWTAVVRQGQGDLYLSLRAPSEAPMTMLWHSNGGRDYAPWSGRHVGCLGVEEGAAAHMLAISDEAELSGPGMLELSEQNPATIRHVIGAIAWPSEERVASVQIGEDRLFVTGDDGTRRDVPVDPDFLAETP